MNFTFKIDNDMKFDFRNEIRKDTENGLSNASISANTLSGVAENGEFTPINEYFEE